MGCMHWLRTTGRLLALIAVLFGIMSLVHRRS